MKGIAHFLSGLAVATFLPGAVQQAADGSLLLVLGGLFGLLPDTLDFRFTRFFEKHDWEIDLLAPAVEPDSPPACQPQEVAEGLAVAMRAAYETGRPRTVMLHTARLGADQWRAYSVRLSSSINEVRVRVGPIVSTAGAPLPGSVPTENAEGCATVGVPMAPTYDDEIKIDAFSGPSLRFERRRPSTGFGQGRGDAVAVAFLPWHRRWTHSLLVAAAAGLGVGLLWGPTAGLISGLGFATHVLGDQLGHMGSNLLWPITARRTHGLGLLHSGDPLPNFLTVWLAVALITFNLDRFSAAPRLPPLPYLLATVLVPALLLGTLHWRASRRGCEPRDTLPVEALRQGELIAETQEVEL